MKLGYVFTRLLTLIKDRLTILYYDKIQAKTTNMSLLCILYLYRSQFLKFKSDILLSHNKNKKFT